MKNEKDCSWLDVVILCGGQGTRFRSVNDKIQKCMTPILGFPFLELLIAYYSLGFNCRRFILCTGYKSKTIEKHEFTNNHCKGIEIKFSVEPRPLGTEGAIKQAQFLIKSDPFLVINGDTWLELDLKELIEKFVKTSLTLEVKSNMFDTGIRLFNKRILDYFTINPFEKMLSIGNNEYVPEVPISDVVNYTHHIGKPFIDLGTPEGYKKMIEYFNGKEERLAKFDRTYKNKFIPPELLKKM